MLVHFSSHAQISILFNQYILLWNSVLVCLSPAILSFPTCQRKVIGVESG